MYSYWHGLLSQKQFHEMNLFHYPSPDEAGISIESTTERRAISTFSLSQWSLTVSSVVSKHGTLL